MIELEGVGVSHGIAIGRALVIGRWELDVPHYNIQKSDVKSELRRILRARNRARAQIVALRDNIRARLGSKYAAIFDAHLMMLGDRELGRETMTRISERLMNAELVSEFRVAREFSYTTKQRAGDGWVLVGDAYGFIDPIYSSGVYFALQTGQMAADAIVAGVTNIRSAVSAAVQPRAERNSRIAIRSIGG